MQDRFSIIPVLDLKGGVVVRARAGDRANYQPIVTPLAATSAAADVLAGLLALAPFDQVYIADLDAIEGTGDHRALILALRRLHPSVEIWLDCGCADAGAAQTIAAAGIVPVLGSESLPDPASLGAIGAALGRSGYVLSLDYRAGAFLGPAIVAERAELWPDRVIAMTLDRVGRNAGPDFARLAAIKARAGRVSVYAAGGVRDDDDVAALAALGISGALVASALHDRRLSRGRRRDG